MKALPTEFYNPYFSLIIGDTLNNKEKTIQCFRELEMIQDKDDAQAIDFYYNWYQKMIRLFAQPYHWHWSVLSSAVLNSSVNY